MTYPGHTYPSQKTLRAQVIHRYMRDAGIARAVCFTCGNAARALRDAGVPVLAVGPGQAIEARRWFTPAEIRNTWPDRFDATSGHLPVDIMSTIADRMRNEWPDPVGPVTVPTGSGETIVCMRLAWPDARLVAAYNNGRPATTYEPAAPLNGLVRIVADRVTWVGTPHEIAPFGAATFYVGAGT